jgi:hypothetical protein
MTRRRSADIQVGDRWDRDGMVHQVVGVREVGSGGLIVTVLHGPDEDAIQRQIEVMQEAEAGEEETE